MDLKIEIETKGLMKVKDFLDQTNSVGKWRTWRNINYKDDGPLKEKENELMKLLEQRKIVVTGGHDQHRWETIMRVPLILRRKNAFSLSWTPMFRIGCGQTYGGIKAG